MVYWYLDEKFIGKAESGKIIINTKGGQHKILVIDEIGQRDETHFEIIAHGKNS